MAYMYTHPPGGGGGVFSKTLYRKTVQENMDEDILRKQYFPGPTWKREKNCLTCYRSQKNLRGGRRRKATADGWALEALVNGATK
jgi:hypothetical protein